MPEPSARLWRCNECGKVSPWVKGEWGWYAGPWADDGSDGIVCSDACDEAMLARWGESEYRPAPHNHRVEETRNG